MNGLGLVCTAAVSLLLARPAYSLGDVIDYGDKSKDIEAATNVVTVTSSGSNRLQCVAVMSRSAHTMM